MATLRGAWLGGALPGMARQCEPLQGLVFDDENRGNRSPNRDINELPSMSNQLVQSSPPRDRETSVEIARSIGRRELADAVHQMFDAAQAHEPDFRFELLATTDLALRTVDLAIAEGWSNWTVATMLSWVPNARPWQLSILASIGSFTRWCPASDLIVALHSVRETLERRARALN